MMKKVVWIVGQQRARSLRGALDGKEPRAMVVDSHHHVGCGRFGCVIFLHDIHGRGRDTGSLQELAKLRDVLGRQFLLMGLMEDMSLLTDREQQSAVRLLACGTESFDEMHSVRPGEIARDRMPE